MKGRTTPDVGGTVARGLLAAPIAAGALGFALNSWAIEMAIVMAVLFAVTATVITVCLAYPLLLWFMKRGSLTLFKALMSGVILGNVPAAIAAIGPLALGTDLNVERLLLPVAVGSLVGLASASAFWAVAGRHLIVPREEFNRLPARGR